MQKGLIGVIVPVYKTEEYIAECIESILAQTYTKFRLILVDDGSPDGAGAICDEYAAKDSRITVLHQENAGVTRARARGVEEASDCEWITFVDSDDTITPDAIKTFQEKTNNDTEIIISYVKNFTASFSKNLSIEKYRYLLLSQRGICITPWGKLFKRELFNENVFDISPEIVIGEDLIMNIRLAMNSDKLVTFISKEIYNYSILPNSISHSYKRNPENEQKIHKHIMASISKDIKDIYIKATITSRIATFNALWGHKYNIDKIVKTEFYTTLKDDIRRYNFKLSPLDYIIFNSSNLIFRFFAINTKKIARKLSVIID